MKPLEGLLQRKGKAPELVTVYKMEMMLLSGWVDEVLCLLYSAADGVPALFVPSTEERIAIGRGHTGHQWDYFNDPSRTYQMLKDIIDGWTPMKDGYTAREVDDEIGIAGDGRVHVFQVEHENRRAYLEVSSLPLCDILKPII